ncbi:hypothetical protein PRECH8_01300 [Insulibacter thermoxylanivorax]|uniref:Uncharacterized protein n=1 Tax=Insulibacter thermoxylanivorax TaxID=2749268 RepID=A0A916QD68_9BACL|nr:hypothetical protein PRECH8_01300 [Insulibacter thermoxylanivorax]
MAARFKGHIDGAAAGFSARHLERMDLRMRLAAPQMRTESHDSPVLDDDAADDGIAVRLSSGCGSKFQSELHIRLIMQHMAMV